MFTIFASQRGRFEIYVPELTTRGARIHALRARMAAKAARAYADALDADAAATEAIGALDPDAWRLIDAHGALVAKAEALAKFLPR